MQEEFWILLYCRTLRSSNERTLKVPLETGTFQDSASRIFNSLPSAARNTETFNVFKGEVRKFLDIKTFSEIMFN